MNKITILITAAIAVLAVSAGAVYQSLCAPQTNLGEYLGSYITSIANGVDHKSILINALKDGLFTVGVIFVCGFVRAGFALSLLAAARRCFVSGFTCAALIGSYGARGILAAAAAELPFMLTLAPLTMLCAFSVKLSFTADRHSRLKAYILLTLAAAVIFAAAALCESYAVPGLIMLMIPNS